MSLPLIEEYKNDFASRTKEFDERYSKHDLTILSGARHQSQLWKLSKTRIEIFKSLFISLGGDSREKLSEFNVEMSGFDVSDRTFSLEEFERAAGHTKMSTKMVGYAREAIVNKVPINKLGSSRERQGIEQACITFYRILDTKLDSRKKQVVQHALDRINDLVLGKIHPNIVLASILNTSIEYLEKVISGDKPASFPEVTQSYLVFLMSNREILEYIEVYSECTEWIASYMHDNKMSITNLIALTYPVKSLQTKMVQSSIKGFFANSRTSKVPGIMDLMELALCLEKTAQLPGDSFRNEIVKGHKKLTGSKPKNIMSFRARKIKDEIDNGRPIMETIEFHHKSLGAATLSKRLKDWRQTSVNKFWLA